MGLYDAKAHELSHVYKVSNIEELSKNNYNEFATLLSKEEFEELNSEGKKILRLGQEIEISPVPMGSKNIFRGKLTTLERVKKARTTDDL